MLCRPNASLREMMFVIGNLTVRTWFSWLRTRTSDGFYWSTAMNIWVPNRTWNRLISWATISFSRKTVFRDDTEWVKCDERLITFSDLTILSMISQRSINFWYGLNQLLLDTTSLLPQDCTGPLNDRRLGLTNFRTWQTSYCSGNSVNNFATFIMRAARDGVHGEGIETN
jgi:hypothetical protein